jgi:hypothetical protein
MQMKKKGSLVHIAPACTGSRERSDNFESYVRNISLHFCKRLFPGLNPWPHGHKATALPQPQGSLSKKKMQMAEKKKGKGSMFNLSVAYFR